MALKLITPPAVEPVTADEVKAYARVDFDDEDAVLDSLIAAAREHVEQVTGRQLVQASARPDSRCDISHVTDRALCIGF